MSESKTSEKRLAAAERQRQALELRKAGAGFETIAERLGYAGPSGAYQAVSAALQKTLQEPADDLRKLELERLDAAQIAIYNQVRQGNFGAIDRLLRIMERRARLLGLDASQRREIAGPDGAPVQIEMSGESRTDQIEHGSDLIRVMEAHLAGVTPGERLALLADYETVIAASNALQQRLRANSG